VYNIREVYNIFGWIDHFSIALLIFASVVMSRKEELEGHGSSPHSR
jgi:hypothetical protein